MSVLFDFENNGRQVSCSAILVDCVQDQLIPSENNVGVWDAFHTFIVRRSQNALGKWPVHVVLPAKAFSGGDRFTGFRVHAKCYSFRPDNPEIIEYGILVWFQDEMNLTIARPAQASINWSDFAEATES